MIKEYKFLRSMIYFCITVNKIAISRSHPYLTFGVFCRTPLNIAIRVKRVIITIDILPGMAVGSTAIESQAIITNKLCLNQKRLLKSIHNGIEFNYDIMARISKITHYLEGI